MVNQSDDTVRERGGIAVRDYTHRGSPPGLEGTRAAFERLNFDRVARGLGWLSLGLGLMEMLQPDRIQKMVGARGDHSRLIRALGLREIGHALHIFMQARPHQAMWSRVAGDAVDLACLGAVFASPRADTGRTALATASVLGLTALDVLTARELGRQRAEARRYSALTRADLSGRAANGAFQVTKSVTINRSPEVLYHYWRNFENLPRFMFHLDAVRVIDQRRSHWVAKAPAGQQVEWDAEITEERPNALIAWRSLPDADVPNAGQVRFEAGPAGRGTVVRVEIEYRPPAGALGKVIAKLFGEEPRQQVAGDLRRFKQVMETGEVMRSDASPHGYGQKLQRPARPLPGGNGGRKPFMLPERPPAEAL